MKLNQIDYVLEVAKHLNFTTAAKKLYISQPALSSQIKSLEDYLDVQLFVRDRRSVKLTEAGKIFVQEFSPLQLQISSAVERVIRSKKNQDDQLFIGYPDAVNVDSFLPEIFSRFKSDYPEINVHLIRCGIQELRKQFYMNELDLIFTFSFDLDSVQDLEVAYVEQRKPCVIMSENNPLASKQSLSTTDIKDQPLICYDKAVSLGAYTLTRKTCNLIGYTPKSIIGASNNDTIISKVSFDQGIALMDDSICNNKPLVAYDILPENQVFHIVCCRKKTTVKPSALSFMENLTY